MAEGGFTNFFKDLFGFGDAPKPKPAARAKKKSTKPPTTTRKQEMQRAAREALIRKQQAAIRAAPIPFVPQGLNQGPLGDFLSSFKSSATLGIPEIAAAALTAPFTDRSFSEELAINRAASRRERDKSFAGNILGSLVGGAAMGVGAAGAARVVGSRLGGTAGKALINATKFKEGEKARNLAKLSAGGAAGSTTEAALRGEDLSDAAFAGAVGAPLLVGGGKAVATIASYPFKLLAHQSFLPSILRGFTKTSREEVAKRAREFRKSTGEEPTLFELLDPFDQKKIINDVLRFNPKAGDRAAVKIGERLQEVPTIARETTEAATAPVLRRSSATIAERLKTARGDISPDDVSFAENAVRDPATLERLRHEEARLIMEPFDKDPVIGDLDSLVPKAPVLVAPGKVELRPDTEIEAAIKAAAGSLRLREPGTKPFTVGEIAALRRNLKDMKASAASGAGRFDKGTIEATIDRVDEVFSKAHPDAYEALQGMDRAFAGASRIAEGAQEGAKTRLRNDPSKFGPSRDQARLTENVFATPEGTIGRAIGQANRLVEMFSGGVQKTRQNIEKVLNDHTIQQALRQNLGSKQVQDVQKSVRVLDNSVRAFTRALRDTDAAKDFGDNLDNMVDFLVIGNPATFPTARAWAIRRLIDKNPISEKAANELVDMLFSRDPAVVRKGIHALRSSIKDAKSFTRDLGFAVMLGNVAQAANEAGRDVPLPAEPTASDAQDAAPAPDVQDAAPAPDYSTMSDEELLQLYQQEQSAGGEPDYSSLSDEELLQLYQQEQSAGGDGEYAQLEQQIYEQADPQFLSLMQAVEQQESGGDPTAVSHKGAVGVMQVMPETAPEAARLAGVPFDPQAYRNDPSYQRLLGAAYLGEMLRQFDGDVALALAAYNAGPGRVKQALQHGQNWFEKIPDETKNYVVSILQNLN